jgi:SET domain-containing protein
MPNCKVEKWIVSREPMLVLVPEREIAPREEITIDYNFDGSDEPFPCLCGQEGCRGVIGRAVPNGMERKQVTQSHNRAGKR